MGDFTNQIQRDDLFSKAVRAGKRTYFFDVRCTKGNDHYLTITESKKRFSENEGKPFYEKHKIFLYKEDFEKFIDGLSEAIDVCKKGKVEQQPVAANENSSPFSDVSFDDLGKSDPA
jgi:hypothetical protein